MPKGMAVILLAIDPGTEDSAWVRYDTATGSLRDWAKTPNPNLRRVIQWGESDLMAIEMVASYGMSVGAEVFETCVWAGRFIECWWNRYHTRPLRVTRKEVALHLCNNPRAGDPNVRQALVDLYGGKEKAIGRKASPGPLYGLSKDGWSALGVAVTATARLDAGEEEAA